MDCGEGRGARLRHLPFAVFNSDRIISLDRRRRISRLAGDLLSVDDGSTEAPSGYLDDLRDLAGGQPGCKPSKWTLSGSSHRADDRSVYVAGWGLSKALDRMARSTPRATARYEFLFTGTASLLSSQREKTAVAAQRIANPAPIQGSTR